MVRCLVYKDTILIYGLGVSNSDGRYNTKVLYTSIPRLKFLGIEKCPSIDTDTILVYHTSILI